MPIARPVPSAASASSAASVPPAIASDSGISAPFAPFAASPNSRAVRGLTSEPTSAPSDTSGTRGGRANPSDWNPGATPPSVSSVERHARVERLARPASSRARDCFVASARPEKPPQHSSAAISSIADGAR